MGESTGLRSTLDDLNKLPFDEPSSARSPSGARSKPAASGAGESLLASLLNETSEEANRELRELQDKLRERRQAEDDARRKEEEQRRKHLDSLREQENRRRGERLREAEEGPAVSKAQPAQAFVAPPIAAPKRSIGGWVVAGVALVAAGAAGTGWYLTQQKAAEQAAAQREAAAKAVPVAGPEPVKLTAPPAVAAAPAPVVVVKRPPVDMRTFELEQGQSARREYEFNYTLAAVDPKPASKPHTGRPGVSRPSEPAANSSGGPRIKIKALNLGGDK